MRPRRSTLARRSRVAKTMREVRRKASRTANKRKAPSHGVLGDSVPSPASSRGNTPTRPNEEHTGPTPVSPSLYEPLDESTGEIRLLDILPSYTDEDEIVSCRMFTAPLEQAKLQYAALSYVWGDANVTENIRVNGFVLPVTVNLASAFKRFRKSDEIRVTARPTTNPLPAAAYLTDDGTEALRCLPLWADAVCINQSDPEEQSRQVIRMASIYSSAANVISWVGEPDRRRINLCFGLMRDLAKAFYCPSDTDPFYSTSENLESGINWLTSQPHLCRLDSPRIGRTGNRYWNTLGSFFHCESWGRVWIRQEVTLARSPQSNLHVCGNEQVNFAEISSTIKFLLSIRNQNVPCPTPVDLLIWLCLRSSPFIPLNHGPCEIYGHKCFPNMAVDLPLIYAFRCKATNPRDHIYGLLGILDSSLHVDYKKPVKEVYLDWMNYVLENGDLTDYATSFQQYLTNAGVGLDKYENRFDLPSWMPNFANMPLRKSTLIVSLRSWREDHRYARDLGEKLQFPSPRITRDGTMSVHGAMCSEVKRVICTRIPLDIQQMADNEITFPEIFAVIYLWFKVATETEKLPDNRTPLMAVLLVLSEASSYVNSEGPFMERIIFGRWFLQGIKFHLLTMWSKNPADSPRVDAALIRTRFLEICELERIASVFEELIEEATPDPYLDQNFTRPLIGAFFQSVRDCHRHAIFQTGNGSVGIGPYGTLSGDRICVLDRCKIPMMLRNVNGCWIFVGTCWVDGVDKLAGSQLYENIAKGELKVEEFLLH
ncbi:heterokaryon incompatibility protein-domain-containing protein [Whalleya microplaca]|nr:heterokaryon incompatibility protein-domain-containing protein [Whalleya microplaca]